MGDKLTILTLAIGVDYRKSLAKALESKRSYAAKHDYNYIEGNEAWWDRTRPIAWSKVPFIIEQLSKLPEDAVIWQSDADVLITNPDMRLEDNVLPLVPEGKDMLLIFDACKHLNSGNILMRNTAWCRDFWRRVNERTEFTYHIWWENMAMIQIIEENAADRAKVEISNQHKRFNAYIMGCDGEPLWQPGDFLVHFAGVYDSAKMSKLIDEIESGKVPRLDMYKP